MANRGSFEFKGMDKLLGNFNKEVQGIKGRTHAGMIEAVIIFQRAAHPATPYDVGNLASSFFSTSWKGEQKTYRPESFKGPDAGKMQSRHSDVISQATAVAKSVTREFQPIMLFGYSANYAPYVHENTELKFKKEGAKARWFYAAIQQNKAAALQAIKDRAKIQ